MFIVAMHVYLGYRRLKRRFYAENYVDVMTSQLSLKKSQPWVLEFCRGMTNGITRNRQVAYCVHVIFKCL